ncbi:DUF1217 domain-containing protein [Bradyrhizobium neotropicale]|uniref:DUF1217 domain-containing protein n=1 Tax=Bradyrhizobium neotropicale TaxID=1497615 RepID=UPI001AD723D7|nr:DUF1217 domain-containing protein [Bradyrhizobium neotropicale]MBO4224002.1 DUF1217 domain-containing protein [Bradyrhizobium neotropicale]
MVSTYASYNSVVRNLQQSLTRVAQQADVTRSAAYYKENIGKIKTVDEFLKNDRLYQYAMKAYGLEDMIYAKAFMKKVLESNLLDANSFANKLTDKRFRDFASAFSFTGSDTPAAQSSNQTDEMIGLYTASVQKRVDAIDEDTNYYNIVIGRVKNVDELLNDDRLRTYVFESFGIDDSNWSRDTIRKVLSSDPSDPNSYINTVWGPQKDAINAKLGQAQAVAADANAKIAQYMSQLSQPGADVPGLRAKITTETNRLAQSRADISSYQDSLTTIGHYFDLAGAFEFSADGTLASGKSAQTDANRKSTNDKFVLTKGAEYLDAEEENESLAIKQFKANISNVKSVQQFMSAPNIYNFALKAVGLDPEKVSPVTIKAVLTSDLSDPTSYAYTLRDDRYIQLAHAFNFDSKGNLTTPLVAQNSVEVTQIVKDYIIAKTRFASATEKDSLRQKAEKDAKYYQTTIAGIESVSELLSDRKLVDIVLVANGLDPTKVTNDYLKKIFNSDLSDPKSFANTASDSRFAEIAASFNFDKEGNVARIPAIGPHRRDQLLETQNNYLQQTLEAQQGEANAGVRLALYFERKSAQITSAYDILADPALAQVFRTTYNLPNAMGGMDIDQQAKIVEKHLNLKDLADPEKLAALLKRFTAMYDVMNNSSQVTSPALAILQGSGTGINQDTLLSIALLGKQR